MYSFIKINIANLPIKIICSDKNLLQRICKRYKSFLDKKSKHFFELIISNKSVNTKMDMFQIIKSDLRSSVLHIHGHGGFDELMIDKYQNKAFLNANNIKIHRLDSILDLIDDLMIIPNPSIIPK